MIYLPRTNHPIPYRPDYYDEQAEFDNSYDYFMALMAYALLEATKHMCEYTKQELIEALRFEYGDPELPEMYLNTADRSIAFLEEREQSYSRLANNALSEQWKIHYERKVIQTRRRLLLWHMVSDYLESEAKS